MSSNRRYLDWTLTTIRVKFVTPGINLGLRPPVPIDILKKEILIISTTVAMFSIEISEKVIYDPKVSNLNQMSYNVKFGIMNCFPEKYVSFF